MLSWINKLSVEIQEAETIKLLRRVFEENFTVDDDSTVSPLSQQTSGTVKNPHDAEAQWSQKRAKQWVGYKAQIAETVEDEICSKGEPTKS